MTEREIMNKADDMMSVIDRFVKANRRSDRGISVNSYTNTLGDLAMLVETTKDYLERLDRERRDEDEAKAKAETDLVPEATPDDFQPSTDN